MLKLGLSHSEYDAYLEALRDSHNIGLEVTLRDGDEQPIGSLTSPLRQVVDGAVQVDSTADVSRSLELTMRDPKRRLKFVANSPASGAVYADRFVSVEYHVFVRALADHVDVPVFWGPVNSLERAGAEVTLGAQGKEALLLAPHYATEGYTLKIRERLDDALRDVAGRAGERRFDLPDLPARLAKEYAVVAQAEPWRIMAGNRKVEGFHSTAATAGGGTVAPATGGSGGGGDSSSGQTTAKHADWAPAPGLITHAAGHYALYYGGDGRLTARRQRKHPVLTFLEGRDLTNRPTVTYDTEAFRNCVHVKGSGPDGKRPPFAKAILPAGNPLSPAALARNGKPRFLTEFVTADGLRTDKACRKRAEEVLARLSVEGVEPAFECLPMPHLEEDDRVRLSTDDFDFTFVLRQFTLPLTATEPRMQIGGHRKVRLWHRRHRTGRRGSAGPGGGTGGTGGRR